MAKKPISGTDLSWIILEELRQDGVGPVGIAIVAGRKKADWRVVVETRSRFYMAREWHAAARGHREEASIRLQLSGIASICAHNGEAGTPVGQRLKSKRDNVQVDPEDDGHADEDDAEEKPAHQLPPFFGSSSFRIGCRGMWPGSVLFTFCTRSLSVGCS